MSVSADLDLELLYVADPMCSWCWGFSPVIGEVDRAYDLPVSVIVGGLRPGDRAEPIEAIKPYLEHHWSQVSAVSGQPFDLAGLERPGWTYDTLTADKAIVAMRSLVPHATLPFLATVQRAFYADRVDVTDPDVYRDLVDGYAIDPDEFQAALVSDTTLADTEADFQRAAWMGVTGFPTLILRAGATSTAVSLGYAPFPQVADRINAIIERSHPASATGLVCDPREGAC